jgi:hypothetical protein
MKQDVIGTNIKRAVERPSNKTPEIPTNLHSLHVKERGPYKARLKRMSLGFEFLTDGYVPERLIRTKLE